MTQPPASQNDMMNSQESIVSATATHPSPKKQFYERSRSPSNVSMVSSNSRVLRKRDEKLIGKKFIEKVDECTQQQL